MTTFPHLVVQVPFTALGLVGHVGRGLARSPRCSTLVLGDAFRDVGWTPASPSDEIAAVDEVTLNYMFWLTIAFAVPSTLAWRHPVHRHS